MPANQILTSNERKQLVDVRDQYQTHVGGFPWPGLATKRGFNGSHALEAAACWNWALSGGMGNIHAAESPSQLYDNVGDIILRGPDAGRPREGLDQVDFPGLSRLEFDDLNAAWQDAAGIAATSCWVSPFSRKKRQKRFQKLMMQYALRRNGFATEPRRARGGNRYVVAMVTKRNGWQSWDHWALKIYDDAGRYVYTQKEPNNPLSIGFKRLWEADRDQRNVCEVPVTGILPAHAEVLRHELQRIADLVQAAA